MLVSQLVSANSVCLCLGILYTPYSQQEPLLMRVTSRFGHRGRGEGLNFGEVQKQERFQRKSEREKKGLWKGTRKRGRGEVVWTSTKAFN